MLAEKQLDDSGIIFPAVAVGIDKDKLGRRPFLLINDSEPQVNSEKDAHGREGFRLSSVLFTNPHFFDVSMIESAYNLRKLLNPKIQMKIFQITRRLGYPNIYSKYFVKKDLSLKECDDITSLFMNGTVKAIPMKGEHSTYDYDGTEGEYDKITEMLNNKI